MLLVATGSPTASGFMCVAWECGRMFAQNRALREVCGVIM